MAQSKAKEQTKKTDTPEVNKQYPVSNVDHSETIKKLEDQATAYAKTIETQSSEIETLKNRIKELEATPSETDPKVFKNKKVTVHHGVNIPGVGKYTKEQILNDSKIQEYLLERKSSAISLNK